MSPEVQAQITIPTSLPPQAVMDSLSVGHGYSWMVLVPTPMRIAHGSTSDGDMPELLIVGKTLLMSGGNEVYIGRLRRMLEVLSGTAVRVRRDSDV